MRGVFRLILALLLVLVIAWIGAWWYVQSRMVLGFRHAEAEARAAGWQVTHGEISRGYSPVTAQVHVADLRLVPPPGAMATAQFSQPELTLPEAGAHIDIGSPLILHLELPLQSTLAFRDGPAFSLSFTSLAALYHVNPDAFVNAKEEPFRGGSLVATGFRLNSANTNFTLISVDTLSSVTTVDRRAGRDATAFSLREFLNGFAVSPIFVTLGHLPFNGQIKSLGLSLDLSGPVPPGIETLPQRMRAALRTEGPQDTQAMLEAAAPAAKSWAQGGGHGKFSLGLDLGPATAHATGAFSFDDRLQPQGSADILADRLGELLAQIATAYPALVGPISGITTALQPYFVKGPDGTQQLKLRLVDQKQVLTANGNKISTVPPVNWNKPSGP